MCDDLAGGLHAAAAGGAEVLPAAGFSCGSVGAGPAGASAAVSAGVAVIEGFGGDGLAARDGGGHGVSFRGWSWVSKRGRSSGRWTYSCTSRMRRRVFRQSAMRR